MVVRLISLNSRRHSIGVVRSRSHSTYRIMIVASTRETVARCATLGRSQDVCKGSRFTVEGERYVVSS